MQLDDQIEDYYQMRGILRPHEIELDAIADGLNIEVRYMMHDSDAVRVGGQPYLIADKRVGRRQQRVEMAHELGHLLMHAGDQLCMRDDFRRLQEREANRFALLALVPKFMLEKELTTTPQYYESQNVALAEAFHVPVWFMTWRMALYECNTPAAYIREQAARYDWR